MMNGQALVQEENFDKWCFKQAVELEHTRSILEEERKKIEQEKEALKWDRMEFEKVKESRKKLMDTEGRIFEMKLNVLKQEYAKLAAEKQYLEKQKKAYGGNGGGTGAKGSGGSGKFGTIFFGGVFDEATLKKRYKDLMKIYHPDNAAGDTSVLQEINLEYEVMKKSYAMG